MNIKKLGFNYLKLSIREDFKNVYIYKFLYQYYYKPCP